MSSGGDTDPPEIIQEFTRVIVFRGDKDLPEITQEFTTVIVFRGIQILQR